MEETVALNIVLLPDESTRERAIELSQLISHMTGTQYVLDEAEYIPHLSLYQALYIANNKRNVIEAVARIAQEIKPFKLIFSGYSYLAEYVYLDAVVSEELREVHQRILKDCNVFREGLIPEPIKELIRNRKLTEAQVEMTLQYGHPLTAALFQPHITLTRLQNINEMPVVLENLPKQEIKATVNQIAMVNVGQHGTCNQIFEVIPLQ